MSVTRTISIILIFAALPLVGCESGRAPSFQLSEQSQDLSGFAQEKVQGELEAGFGTPSNLVVWSKLNVDFGQYSGTVSKVGPRPGTLKIAGEGLAVASGLAGVRSLDDLKGAAVVVSSPVVADEGDVQSGGQDDSQAEDAPATEEADSSTGEPDAYLVASYDPVDRLLSVVNGNGQPAQLNAFEGDTVQILGPALQKGRNLYLRHCMHCHGVSGDGAGPTAQYFKVKPRDYRQGVVKFTSTKANVPRPNRDDLFRIIKLGVPGTYMPSFMLLPDEEVNTIVEYVRWLAMRGEMERKLNAWLSLDYSKEAVADMEEPTSEIEAAFAEAWAEEASDNITQFSEELQLDWEEANKGESIVVPTVERIPSSPDSIKRGREIFRGNKAKCASCHGKTGRGNGPSTEGFNDLPGQPGVKSDKAGLFDIWGNIVKPRNLTTGVFRGGRRPIDIFRRIHSGIKGTPMQAFGTTLKEEEIWDVVNYVINVPFEDKQSEH
jgi:mono/diheme cytochrome c family protein